jgi:hypothetical protein
MARRKTATEATSYESAAKTQQEMLYLVSKAQGSADILKFSYRNHRLLQQGLTLSKAVRITLPGLIVGVLVDVMLLKLIKR